MKDHSLVGFCAGLALLGLVYASLTWIISRWGVDSPYLMSPKPQLFSLALSLVIARYVLVNRGQVRTGKGMFLGLLVTAFVYIFYSIRFRHGY